MTRFELFTMVFYVLDAAWESEQNEKLGEYLSAANPFLFKDIDSADPAVFEDFSIKTPERIDIEESYSIAKQYVESLDIKEVKDAFNRVDADEWIEGIEAYLSAAHKSEVVND